MNSAVLIITLALAAPLIILVVWHLNASRVSFPPGPRGFPLLGVALEHPKTEYWKTYARWGRENGDTGIISFHVFGRRMVVLNSSKTAEDLLVRRSAIYSDRPFPTMAKLMKRERNMFSVSNNERLKTYRRLMHHNFNAVASQQYWPMIERQARVLVENVDCDPAHLFRHLRVDAAAVTMEIAYGYPVTHMNDRFVTLAEEGMRIGSLAFAPGKWIVDSIPVLQYVPAWFPGAGFRRRAKEWGDQLYVKSLEPHDWVKKQMSLGTWTPSFTSRLLEARDPHVPPEQHEDLIFWTAGAIYSAGADTTVAGVNAFIFAMMLHPDIQERAQAEVDALIAKEHRLPNIGDRRALPYLEAILKEVMRWAPPAPLGVSHASAVDDTYLATFIPAKTTVIANIWAMLHDESVYPNPERFDPERFLPPTGGALGELKVPQRNPLDLVFGFGRRICTGQHIAEASMFIQMAIFLAVLNISKGVDAQGKEIEPEVAFTTAIVSHVKPFAYKIARRRGKAMDLLKQELETGE